MHCKRGATEEDDTMKANKTINLSTKTNLLEQDLYEYKLQDVSQPELFREIFPYNEVPKVSYN